eukprot:g35642.t1
MGLEGEPGDGEDHIRSSGLEEMQVKLCLTWKDCLGPWMQNRSVRDWGVYKAGGGGGVVTGSDEVMNNVGDGGLMGHIEVMVKG